VARPEKVAAVAEIESLLSSGESTLFVEMRGLTVAEAMQLRRKFHESNVTFKVHKNTLIQIAANNLHVHGMEPYLHGPTALAVSHTELAAAVRVVRDFTKTVDKVAIKGGLLGKQTINAADAASLIDMPTRQEAVAQLAGVLNAPIVGIATVLNAPIAGLARSLGAVIGGLAIALNAVAEQKGESPSEA
jgi:large subunit ribosomal protein L10